MPSSLPRMEPLVLALILRDSIMLSLPHHQNRELEIFKVLDEYLEKIPSRFDLILMASKRARQLSTTSRDPLVEWDNDKPTLVALREIEEGLLDLETLEKTLEEDVLLDEFSAPSNQENSNEG